MLRKKIQEWLREGEELIISGDTNDEVTGDNIEAFFEKYKMKECLTELVENPPETCSKNKHNSPTRLPPRMPLHD